LRAADHHRIDRAAEDFLIPATHHRAGRGATGKNVLLTPVIDRSADNLPRRLDLREPTRVDNGRGSCSAGQHVHEVAARQNDAITGLAGGNDNRRHGCSLKSSVQTLAALGLLLGDLRYWPKPGMRSMAAFT